MTAQNLSLPSAVSPRLTGFLYLMIIVFGLTSEVMIRHHLVVPGDAGATANNLLASPDLFRLGFAADAVMLICDVALAVLFYLLFKPVSRPLAMAASAFRFAQAAILGMNLLNYYAALLILNGANYAVLGMQQQNELASLLLELHSHGYDLGLIFFGVSNVLLGILVIRSNFLPKLLGYGLIAAAIVYLIGSFTRFLMPEAVETIQPLYLIPVVAELAFCLWLLIKGIAVPTPPLTNASA
ncbi:MAG: DUF4386 domain-containing protein [Hydrogenovibrio sp.]|nr:DUF4386 domain-containing protein [Hydrogenovibrio sp.]